MSGKSAHSPRRDLNPYPWDTRPPCFRLHHESRHASRQFEQALQTLTHQLHRETQSCIMKHSNSHLQDRNSRHASANVCVCVCVCVCFLTCSATFCPGRPSFNDEEHISNQVKMHLAKVTDKLLQDGHRYALRTAGQSLSKRASRTNLFAGFPQVSGEGISCE